MNYINRNDTQHKQMYSKPNSTYIGRNMDKYSDKEIRDAIRKYDKALKSCYAEIRSRRNKKK